MVLQYSNQETSVTIGESVRDEDGKRGPSLPAAGARRLPRSLACLADELTQYFSVHPAVYTTERYQRWAHGTSDHNQRL